MTKLSNKSVKDVKELTPVQRWRLNHPDKNKEYSHKHAKLYRQRYSAKAFKELLTKTNEPTAKKELREKAEQIRNYIIEVTMMRCGGQGYGPLYDKMYKDSVDQIMQLIEEERDKQKEEIRQRIRDELNGLDRVNYTRAVLEDLLSTLT